MAPSSLISTAVVGSFATSILMTMCVGPLQMERAVSWFLLTTGWHQSTGFRQL
jgi:hypothetical protein